MSFVQLGMGHGGSVNDRFVIAKEHHGGMCHIDTQVTEDDAKIDDLFRGCAGSDAFRTKGCSFDGRLQFRMKVDDRLVRHVWDTSNGASTDEIVIVDWHQRKRSE